MSEFSEDLSAFLRDAADDLRETATRTVPHTTGALKHSVMVPMSFEMLIDSGAMTEEEALAKGWQKPTPVHVPRLTRLHRSWQWWWADHRPHVHLGPCDHGDCI